jgi:hypothetical protein
MKGTDFGQNYFSLHFSYFFYHASVRNLKREFVHQIH